MSPMTHAKHYRNPVKQCILFRTNACIATKILGQMCKISLAHQLTFSFAFPTFFLAIVDSENKTQKNSENACNSCIYNRHRIIQQNKLQCERGSHIFCLTLNKI